MVRNNPVNKEPKFWIQNMGWTPHRSWTKSNVPWEEDAAESQPWGQHLRRIQHWCSTSFLCWSARGVAMTPVYESGWHSPVTLKDGSTVKVLTASQEQLCSALGADCLLQSTVTPIGKAGSFKASFSSLSCNYWMIRIFKGILPPLPEHWHLSTRKHKNCFNEKQKRLKKQY